MELFVCVCRSLLFVQLAWQQLLLVIQRLDQSMGVLCPENTGRRDVLYIHPLYLVFGGVGGAEQNVVVVVVVSVWGWRGA